jgi:hypothetical protein
MKKIILLLLPLNCIAQGYFVMPNAGFANTTIFNKEDTKISNQQLAMQTSFAPNFGINFGKQKILEKRGIMAIVTGVNYTPIVQKYAGQHVMLSNTYLNSTSKATATLKYLNVPLQLMYALTNPKKVTPILQCGININLLTGYSVFYDAIIPIEPPTGPTTIEFNYSLRNNTIVNKQGTQGFANYNIDKWYYKRLLVGANLAVGTLIKLNTKCDLSIVAGTAVSILNPENSTMIKHIIKTGNMDELGYAPTATFNPVEKRYSMFRLRGNLPAKKASHNIATGLNIGIKYYLFTTNVKNNL